MGESSRRLADDGITTSSDSVPSDAENEDYVLVKKSELVLLRSEVMRLKRKLPSILTTQNLTSICALPHVRKELDKTNKKLKETRVQVEHWRSQCESSRRSCEQEKEKKFAALCESQELQEQLDRQSDYCVSMGAACCVLLWRVSRCEESIQAILVGSKVEEFMAMTSSTIQTYVATYKQQMPEENANETQFVLSLCGIITNIAASVYGREYLVSNKTGTDMLDTLITVLSDAPNGQCSSMKNLILMTLFNVSINQKGLLYMSKKSGFLRLLVWLLQEEKRTDNRLHTIRLIQSLLYDSSNSVKLLMELEEALPEAALMSLCSDPCKDLQEASLELMSDLKTMKAALSSQSGTPRPDED